MDDGVGGAPGAVPRGLAEAALDGREPGVHHRPLALFLEAPRVLLAHEAVDRPEGVGGLGGLGQEEAHLADVLRGVRVTLPDVLVLGQDALAAVAREFRAHRWSVGGGARVEF